MHSGAPRRGTTAAVLPARLGLINSASRFRKLLPYMGAALVAIIAAAAYSTIEGMAKSRDWLAHTYEVKSELTDLELHRAQLHEYAAESSLAASADEQARSQAAAVAIRRAVARLKQLTQDNTDQQQRLEQLGPILEQHLKTLNPSGKPAAPTATQGRKSANTRLAISSDGPSNSRPAPSAVAAIEPLADQDARIGAIVAGLQGQESNLLAIRQTAWDREFRRNILVLAFAVGACLMLLFANIRLLREDVRSSRIATEHNRESADSYRALSARIIGLQDAERRKIGRDLHDSIGQSLAALQMNLDQLALASPQGAPLIADSLDLVRRSAQDVRTISHLLHPPLLDVIGFAAAAQNYAQQFARRSKIQANLNLPDELSLPSKEVELVLFRVLQESLTNVHRHAQASTVDIRLALEDHQAVLKIQDNGQGLPVGVIEGFKAGMASGVGLGGMRERLAEFGGNLEVESSPRGTTVRASVPV